MYLLLSSSKYLHIYLKMNTNNTCAREDVLFEYFKNYLQTKVNSNNCLSRKDFLSAYFKYLHKDYFSTENQPNSLLGFSQNCIKILNTMEMPLADRKYYNQILHIGECDNYIKKIKQLYGETFFAASPSNQNVYRFLSYAEKFSIVDWI